MGIFRLTFLKFFIVVVATSLVVSGLYVFTTFAVLITPKFRVPRMRFCFAIIFLSHLCAVVRPSSASHHQDRNQTRVAILTWATPPAITKYQDMLNTKTCYTLKHGYSFLLESNMLETEKNIFWNKQRAVSKYLPYFDWIMWTDADTAVMNEHVRLEDFVLRAQQQQRQRHQQQPAFPPDVDLILDDHSGPISAGVYMLRNSEWSRWFLEHWEKQDALNTVWEDNGALYHALLYLVPQYTGACSTPDITSSHDKLVACLQENLDRFAGVYGERALPHVALLNPKRDSAQGARGMAFWDREWGWPRELQYQNGDFMVHSKAVERYSDVRQRKSCVS